MVNWSRASSVEVEFEVESRSRAKRVEALEASGETSVEVVVAVTLLALGIHGILAVVELGPHLWTRREEMSHITIINHI